MSCLNETRELLWYDSLNAYPGVMAFTTTRSGGCSEGAYTSFNCNPYCGDESACVNENCRRLLRLLPVGLQALVIPHQVHGARVQVIDEAYVKASPEERTALLEGVDALVTDLSGYCLCISTADCVPLLLYDARLQVVGAVHAGWRGTVQGIAGKTLQVMHDVYGSRPQDVRTCIGPSISLEAFEVGIEVYEAFRQAGFPMDKVARWCKLQAKWHIDLWEANRWLLLSAGVDEKHVEVSGVCTYLQHEEFFSARRLGIASGRMLSGIMLK